LSARYFQLPTLVRQAAIETIKRGVREAARRKSSALVASLFLDLARGLFAALKSAPFDDQWIDGSFQAVAGEQAVEAPKRAKRRRGSALEQWEVAIVKAMLAKQDRTDQDILAYFTRPTRSVDLWS
jgi:hypothetical protein